jgi:hypothetical protein
MPETLFHLGHSPEAEELTIAQDARGARTASICLWHKDRRFLLKFVNPQPLAALVEVFDCHEVIVTDRNAAEAAQLEFGRYRVEFRDEDNPIGDVVADDFDYEAIYPAPGGA